ncbi:MAG: S8 family peptidase [Flavobacteriales bacterium]
MNGLQVLSLGVSLLFGSLAVAQTAPGRYWVQFEGKEIQQLPAGHTTPFLLNDPEAFLSHRAIARRQRQGIAIQTNDMPIPPTYIHQLDEMQELDVILKSKWFNAVTVSIRDTTFDIQSLMDLPFVIGIKSVEQISRQRWNAEPIDAFRASPINAQAEPGHYGKGWDPLTQLGADWLHGLGFRGEGMWIGVLDAGFENVDKLPIFETARQQERIHEGMDAMASQAGLYAHHRHGTSVLGTMAGFLPDSLIGTAPDAHYWLYRTEDAYSEFVIEEDYWIAAAEHADSTGVDLINTSLGYSLFDDSTMNHTAQDLDGHTARISQAMTWAAEKGILCVTSAGNSGNSEWHYITAPADAHGILSVGAVNGAGQHASFSGWGPSADGRIKPEVMALGVQAAYPHADSTIKQGNGTSFSSPILCGASACLWQAFPEKSAAEIRNAIISSAHLSTQPNDSLGHGIPDMRWAFALLANAGAANWSSMGPENSDLLLFPNPSKSSIIRWQFEGQGKPNRWMLWNEHGQLVGSESIAEWQTADGKFQGWAVAPRHLKSGTYVFQLLENEASLTSARWMLLNQ